MKNLAIILSMAMFAFALISCGGSQTCEQLENQRAGIAPQGVDFQALPNLNMKVRLESFASFKLTTDLSHLSEKEKQILNNFFEASKIIDNLYWKQTLGNKDGFLSQIQGEDAKKYALFHYGPWDRLDNNLSFLTNVGPKPDGANFYPQDMTKEEFEQLADTNKTSQYTVIRRDDARPSVGNVLRIFDPEAKVPAGQRGKPPHRTIEEGCLRAHTVHHRGIAGRGKHPTGYGVRLSRRPVVSLLGNKR